jgi:hypothetical protein
MANEIKITLDEKKLLKAGFRAIELMNQQVAKSKDVENKAYKPYSTAYSEWKERKYPQFKGKVNLTRTGRMLRGLNDVAVDKNEINIRFADQESAEIAYYHNVMGAGKAKVIRRFLGLTEKELEDKTLNKFIGEAVEIRFL